MKKIGLVGGTTPESTKLYYDLLIQGARKEGDDPLRNPVILIYSVDLAELVGIQRSGERSDVVDYVADILERLRVAGAEIGALTANTPHVYLEEIREATSLPLVSIVTATRDAASKRQVRRTLLLGTSTTMAAAMYPRELAEAGIDVVVPNAEDRQFLDATIYGELALGKVTPQVQNRVRDICKKHMDQDRIDAVILGCTELPLVITNHDLPVHVFDTTKLHAGAILAAAS